LPLCAAPLGVGLEHGSKGFIGLHPLLHFAPDGLGAVGIHPPQVIERLLLAGGKPSTLLPLAHACTFRRTLAAMAATPDGKARRWLLYPEACT
jgi:hypothetical protein